MYPEQKKKRKKKKVKIEKPVTPPAEVVEDVVEIVEEVEVVLDEPVEEIDDEEAERRRLAKIPKIKDNRLRKVHCSVIGGLARHNSSMANTRMQLSSVLFRANYKAWLAPSPTLGVPGAV